MALFCLEMPSASASLWLDVRRLNVAAQIQRINYLCLWITGRHFGLHPSQSPHRLGPTFHPSRVVFTPSVDWRHDPKYKIRPNPPVRAEYPFEYASPHSPIGAPATASTDYPPPLGYTHTSIPEVFSQETSHFDDCPNTPPSLHEADSKARAVPTDIPQTQRARLSEQLSFLTLHV